MTRRITFAAVGAVALVLLAFAALQWQRPQDVTDVLLRVNGPLHLAEGDTASTVVVVGHDAAVEGTVTEQLVVVGGTAHVTGEVQGNLVVVNGRAELGPGAFVGQNVVLHESTLERAPDARIGGIVKERPEFEWSPAVGWLFWLSFTGVLLAAGLAFAALAGRQLYESARLISRRPAPVVVTALIVVIGLPAVAVLAFFSVIGIPLGLLILLFLIPSLALLGIAVTATWIGSFAVRRWGSPERRERLRDRPYVAVLIGVVALQIVAIVPVLGGLVLIVASQLGAGALVYRAWRGTRAGASH